MPVAHLLGWFKKSVKGFEWFTPKLKPENIVFIGLRDIDEGEKELIREHKIKYFSIHELDKYGIGNVMD